MLADLDDHVAHSSIPSGAPAYAWARRVLLTSLGPTTRPVAAARDRRSMAERIHSESGAHTIVKCRWLWDAG
jgi:hypothetical protein